MRKGNTKAEKELQKIPQNHAKSKECVFFFLLLNLAPPYSLTECCS